MWLSGLSIRLWSRGSLVQFPVRAHAWVAGQVPSRGCSRGNHILIFLSLSFSLPSPLSKNKQIKSKKKSYMFLKKIILDHSNLLWNLSPSLEFLWHLFCLCSSSSTFHMPSWTIYKFFIPIYFVLSPHWDFKVLEEKKNIWLFYVLFLRVHLFTLNSDRKLTNV